MQYEGNDIWSFHNLQNEKIFLHEEDIKFILNNLPFEQEEEEDEEEQAREEPKKPKPKIEQEKPKKQERQTKNYNRGFEIANFYDELLKQGIRAKEARMETAKHFNIKDKTVQRHIYPKQK